MNNNKTLKYEACKIFNFAVSNSQNLTIFGVCKSQICNSKKSKIFSHAPNISCSRVHLEILELLYKQKRRCSAGVKEEFLIEKLEGKIDNSKLKIHVDYLEKKGHIIIKPVYDGFVTIKKITITPKGVNLFENQNASI